MIDRVPSQSVSNPLLLMQTDEWNEMKNIGETKKKKRISERGSERERIIVEKINERAKVWTIPRTNRAGGRGATTLEDTSCAGYLAWFYIHYIASHMHWGIVQCIKPLLALHVCCTPTSFNVTHATSV